MPSARARSTSAPPPPSPWTRKSESRRRLLLPTALWSQCSPSSCSVRPGPVLRRTMDYLMSEVVDRKDVPFIEVRFSLADCRSSPPTLNLPSPGMLCRCAASSRIAAAPFARTSSAKISRWGVALLSPTAQLIFFCSNTERAVCGRAREHCAVSYPVCLRALRSARRNLVPHPGESRPYPRVSLFSLSCFLPCFAVQNMEKLTQTLLSLRHVYDDNRKVCPRTHLPLACTPVRLMLASRPRAACLRARAR